MDCLCCVYVYSVSLCKVWSAAMSFMTTATATMAYNRLNKMLTSIRPDASALPRV